MSKVTKIAVFANGFVYWNGGVEFLKYVIEGLVIGKSKNKFEIFIFIPAKKLTLPRFIRKNTRSLQRIFSLPINLHHKNYKAENLFEEFKKEVNFVHYDEQKIEIALKKNKIDVILPIMQILSEDFSVNWIGYLSDCQHKHYPELFSKEEIQKRDLHFSNMIDKASKIIVNSKDTKNDLIKFFNAEDKQVHSLPFTPTARSEWFTNIPEILEKYDLPEKYFIIANQFWVHKSHIIAFEALAKLTTKDIHIICTGKMEDYRDRKHIQKLKQLVKDLNVENQVHFLGFIPKRDQIEIMKNAIAVIQPTLFEGGPGGGSVYNAVSLGIPCIISDIPVNKEVNGRNVFFFKSKDSGDLAEKMQEILSSAVQRPTLRELLLLRERYLNLRVDSFTELLKKTK